eukprot:gene18295-24755_t
MDEPADKKRRASKKLVEAAAMESKVPAVNTEMPAVKRLPVSRKLDGAAAIATRLPIAKKRRASKKLYMVAAIATKHVGKKTDEVAAIQAEMPVVKKVLAGRKADEVAAIKAESCPQQATPNRASHMALKVMPQSPSPGSDGFVGKGHWKEGIGREVRIDQADSWPGGVRYPVEQ